MGAESNIYVNDRIIMLSDNIDFKSSVQIIYAILEINKQDETKNVILERRQPIKLFINTNGGYVYDLLAIIDVIENSKTPVHTYGLGRNFSCGFLLLISGHKRFISKNSFAMIHYMHSGVSGSIEDIKVESNLVEKINKKIDKIIVNKTKITQEQIDENTKTKKDWYFDADECLEYKIADEFYTK